MGSFSSICSEDLWGSEGSDEGAIKRAVLASRSGAYGVNVPKAGSLQPLIFLMRAPI